MSSLGFLISKMGTVMLGFEELCEARGACESLLAVPGTSQELSSAGAAPCPSPSSLVSHNLLWPTESQALLFLAPGRNQASPCFPFPS